MAPRRAMRRQKHILVKTLPTAAYAGHLGFEVKEIVRDRGDTRGGNTQFVAVGPGGIVYKSRKVIRDLLLEVGLPWFHPSIDGTEPAMIANYENSVPDEARPDDDKPPAKDCINALLPAESGEDDEDAETSSDEVEPEAASDGEEVAAGDEVESEAASDGEEVAAGEEKYKGEIEELQNMVKKLQRELEEQGQVLEAERAEKRFQKEERQKSEMKCKDLDRDIKFLTAHMTGLSEYAKEQERECLRAVLLLRKMRKDGYSEVKRDVSTMASAV
eukprot:TRINITY_DN440_c0_g3_i1.p1 TRINITY_DN440_c0_g3~~TRINITY_DN440_c0_g3_i1.p1  ORF type:complete len:298 (+),score=58.93 TRINITY_DN440_c0_g3_i1:78-896(+)